MIYHKLGQHAHAYHVWPKCMEAKLSWMMISDSVNHIFEWINLGHILCVREKISHNILRSEDCFALLIRIYRVYEGIEWEFKLFILLPRIFPRCICWYFRLQSSTAHRKLDVTFSDELARKHEIKCNWGQINEKYSQKKWETKYC